MPASLRRAALLLALSVALTASCADVIGLERGVLAMGGSSSGATAAGGTDTAGAPAGASAGSEVNDAGEPSLGGTSTGGSGGASIGGEPVGGTASDAGAAGTENLGGEPSTGPCKYGTCSECPEDMVLAMSQEAFYFCIDSAEVTNEQYLAFTKRYTADTVTASSACANNPSLVPDTDCSTALTDVPSRKLPVVCVDFCDAEAYCAMHGKRLCGRVGGTMNDPGDNANGAASEWYAACSGLSETTYPYGESASQTKCNASGYAPSDMGPRDVETLSECEGSVGGLYNMSGNVAEWEWSCSSTSVNATCSTRGGSYQDGPYEVRCTGSINMGRMDAQKTVGFRCCANLDQ